MADQSDTAAHPLTIPGCPNGAPTTVERLGWMTPTLLLLATVHRNEPGRRTLNIAGIAALIMDIYTW